MVSIVQLMPLKSLDGPARASHADREVFSGRSLTAATVLSSVGMTEPIGRTMAVVLL